MALKNAGIRVNLIPRNYLIILLPEVLHPEGERYVHIHADPLVPRIDN